MKKVYILFLFASLSYSLTAQNADDKDKELVKQLIIDVFEDIYSDFKTDKVLVHHTEDFLLLENGEVWTNDTIIKFQQDQLKDTSNIKRHNRIEFIEVKQPNKKTIWLAYHNFANWTKDNQNVGSAQWLESAVAVKTKEGWKLKTLHSTWVKSGQ